MENAKKELKWNLIQQGLVLRNFGTTLAQGTKDDLGAIWRVCWKVMALLLFRKRNVAGQQKIDQLEKLTILLLKFVLA